jgi:hypothetical protein
MNEIVQFVGVYFVPLMMGCAALFVVGLLMRFVGNHIDRKHTKIKHQHEWDMEPDEWEAWAREQGYKRAQR